MSRIDIALFLIQFHSITASSRGLVNMYKMTIINSDKTMQYAYISNIKSNRNKCF